MRETPARACRMPLSNKSIQQTGGNKMAQAYVSKEVTFRHLLIKKTVTSDTTLAVFTFLLIGSFAFLGIYNLNPPRAVAASAPAAEFSSGRAIEHLRVIAKAPHPVGSVAHGEVKEFLLNSLTGLGLKPEVQTASVVDENRGLFIAAAKVENIIAQIDGTGGGKSVLFVSHYDSVPNAPGASDNGAAVAAMLETARALKTGPALKNDIVFLFTDAEELGLLGAKAFVKEHPLAKKIGLVVNLEARGNTGPSMMFETSAHNGWLVDNFAAAAPYPIANSLSYEIYKLLPNDTDLSVFKRAGYTGLNLAYIDGATHYHTELDSVERMDEASLQHHGSYALALAKHFGNIDLENTKSEDAVYFDLFGAAIIRYPAKWSAAFAGLAIIFFITVAAFGFKKKLLTLKGAVFGFAALASCMLVAGGVTGGLWFIIRMFHPEHTTLPQGEIYNNKYYIISFAAITVAVTSALYIWFRNKSSMQNLMAGALIWNLLLTAATAAVLPGGSYLFTWPLMFNTIALGFVFASKQSKVSSTASSVAVLICSIPAVVLFVPLILVLFIALTTGMAWAVAPILVLLLGMLIPQLSLLARPVKWALPMVAALVAAGSIVTATVKAATDDNNPKPNSLFYAMSADTGKATWASYDSAPDAWTSQFLSQPQRGPLTDYLPSTYPGFLKSEAPPIAAAPPEITVLSDSKINGNRTLRLRVASRREAPFISVYITSDSEFERAAVGDTPVSRKLGNRLGLTYEALPKEGVEITLETRSAEPLKIRVMDVSFGLPELAGQSFKPRPSNMIGTRPYSDATIISKSYSF